MKKKKNKARMSGFWYFTTYYECPVCGKGDKIRERRYSKKPDDVWERHEFIIRYDHCDQ